MVTPKNNSAEEKIESRTAPVLSRNVPEPTSYTGKYYVKLPFEEEQYFSPTKTEAPDYALKFDGIGDCVQIRHNDELAITDKLTICAWVKVDDLSRNHSILGKTDQNIPAPYDYYLVPPTGCPNFLLGNGAAWAAIRAPTGITMGIWQHIAVTVEAFPAQEETPGYYIVKHYINGEVKGEGKIMFSAATLGDKGRDLYIGSRHKKDMFMKGQIDQVQIWNRVLSPDEIKAFKDSVLAGFEDGLAGCWSMNDGTGEKVTDISPNGLHGKREGTTWILSDRAVTQSPRLNVEDGTLKTAFDDATQHGQFHPTVFPNLVWITTETDRTAAIQALKKADGTPSLDFEDFRNRYRAGERLRIFRSINGELAFDFIRDPSKVESSMFLIETYRLSSFLGAYGAGRTVRTFSLLPGEKTSISISTYKKSEKTTQEASSIFDSYNQESASDFSKELATEQSDTRKSDSSFSWHAEAEVEASWGWGSAKVSGGASGSSNSSRESFAKGVSNVTSKHAAKASAKRDVQINTSSEVKTAEGEETAIQRVIENINVSRTLNFIFRQMNQEYITLLHLVDVKVGFGTAGILQSRRIVPLPELDSLIEEVVVNDKEKRRHVKDFIIGELENIRDHLDKTVKEHQATEKGHPNFVEKVVIKDAKGSEAASYHRLRKDFTSTYADPATGTRITVPGIIINADKVVMRTDDIVVDALLGDGDALDDYSKGLQNEAVSAEQVQNEFLLLKNQLLKRIVNAPDKKSAEDALEVYMRIFGDVPIKEIHVEAPPPEDGRKHDQGKRAEKDRKAAQKDT